MEQRSAHLCAIMTLLVTSTLSGEWGFQDLWNYDISGNFGPQKWNLSWPECSHTAQSPVDLDSRNVWYSNSLTGFEMIGYESIPPNTHWELINVGHSVHLEFESNYRLREGGLPGEYIAQYMTFHWGPTNTTGSEHTIDGRAHAMEIQVVHYKAEYDSFEAAMAHSDGITILAYLLKTKPYGNPSFSQIINNLENISEEGSSVPLRPIPLLSLVPINTNDYYRYDGSLTTPPCRQVVQWSVFSDLAIISEKQLEAFRAFKSRSSTKERNKYQSRFPRFESSSNLLHSSLGKCRPLQPLGGRTIYSSHYHDATLLTSPTRSTISIILTFSLGFLLILIIISRTVKEDPDDHILNHND